MGARGTTYTAVMILAVMLAMIVAAATPSMGQPPIEHAQAEAGFGPRLQSASVRDRDVYLHVQGTGLYVDYVYSRAYPSAFVCTRAEFFADGVLKARTSIICIDGSNGQHGAAQWNTARNFPDGTRLCVSWTGIAGEPCATVHD